MSQQGALYTKIVKEIKTANIWPISSQESTDSGSETTEILSNIEEIGSETTEILSNIQETRQNMIQL